MPKKQASKNAQPFTTGAEIRKFGRYITMANKYAGRVRVWKERAAATIEKALADEAAITWFEESNTGEVMHVCAYIDGAQLEMIVKPCSRFNKEKLEQLYPGAYEAAKIADETTSYKTA